MTLPDLPKSCARRRRQVTLRGSTYIPCSRGDECSQEIETIPSCATEVTLDGAYAAASRSSIRIVHPFWIPTTRESRFLYPKDPGLITRRNPSSHVSFRGGQMVGCSRECCNRPRWQWLTCTTMSRTGLVATGPVGARTPKTLLCL